MKSGKAYLLLKGFTLVEILFTLILTSICLMGAYKGIDFMQALLRRGAEKTNFIASYCRISRAISTAYADAERIEFENGKCSMLFADSSKAEIELFPDFLVFCQRLQRDTLFATCEFSKSMSISTPRIKNVMSLKLNFQGNTYSIYLQNTLSREQQPV